MVNGPDTWSFDDYKCIRSMNYYQDVRERTDGNREAMLEARKTLQRVARDHARVPMQWDDSPNAGFCVKTCEPWMSVLDTYHDINVASQLADEGRVLSYWRRMLRLRKQNAGHFVYGRFKLLQTPDNILAFMKHGPRSESRSLTVANLAEEVVDVVLPTEFDSPTVGVLVSTHSRTILTQRHLTLGPFEALVLGRT